MKRSCREADTGDANPSPQKAKRAENDDPARNKIVAALNRACAAAGNFPNNYGDSLYNAIAAARPTEGIVSKARTLAFNLKRNGEHLAQFSASDLVSMSPQELAKGTQTAEKREACCLGGWKPVSAESLPTLPESSAWNSSPSRVLELVLMDERAYEEFLRVWRTSSIARVVVRKGDITALEGDFDALVSPANTMGNMDGGIDRAYAAYLGWSRGRPYEDPNPLQLAIDEQKGEPSARLEMGQAILVRDRKTHLIASPTMELPGKIPINSRIVYDAAKAAFGVWRQTQDINVVRMPSFGTGYGQVPAEISAAQMLEAFCDAWK